MKIYYHFEEHGIVLQEISFSRVKIIINNGSKVSTLKGFKVGRKYSTKLWGVESAQRLELKNRKQLMLYLKLKGE